MKLSTLVIILLLCAGTSAYSQTNLPDRQASLDSLYAVWQDETKPDSIRAAAYKDYIWKGFLFSNADTAFILAKDLVVFGQEKAIPKCTGNWI